MNPWGGAFVAAGLLYLGFNTGWFGVIPLAAFGFVVWKSWPRGG
jgi:hypothetical protein